MLSKVQNTAYLEFLEIIDEITEEFIGFMNEYNRNYGSLEEFKKREKIFRENKVKIN